LIGVLLVMIGPAAIYNSRLLTPSWRASSPRGLLSTVIELTYMPCDLGNDQAIYIPN